MKRYIVVGSIQYQIDQTTNTYILRNTDPFCITVAHVFQRFLVHTVLHRGARHAWNRRFTSMVYITICQTPIHINSVFRTSQT